MEEPGILVVKQQGDHICISSPFCDVLVDVNEGRVRIRVVDNGNARIETQHVSWRDGRAMAKIEVMHDVRSE